ncbi:MAG: M12 family metallo-peptidase, partial [Bacteroidota bacterium]
KILASIWHSDKFYSVETVEDDIQFVTEIDLGELARNDCKVEFNTKNRLSKSTQIKSVNSVTTTDTIKVLVAYSAGLLAYYNNDVTPINNLINTCEFTTNGVFIRSGANSATIKVVHRPLYTYSLTGTASIDVESFKNNNYIKGLRNQYQADVCILLVNSLDDNGSVPDGAIPATYENAYCIVKAASAVGYYSFTHELGHLFGGRHQIGADNNMENSHGKAYKHNGSDTDPLSFLTVMAVYAVIDKPFYDCRITRRVGYFSNPSINEPVSGVPTGDGPSTYVVGEINGSAYTLASFQPRYTTSGIISVNEWWRGNITVTGTVTVASGVTLTVEPGATISFASSASITVNGTLYAVGNTSNPITFTKSSTSNWGGIQFNSGSSGNLQYCNIQNAGNGIYCYNSSPTIKYSTIDNNYSTGLYLNYYSSPVLKG